MCDIYRELPYSRCEYCGWTEEKTRGGRRWRRWTSCEECAEINNAVHAAWEAIDVNWDVLKHMKLLLQYLEEEAAAEHWGEEG